MVPRGDRVDGADDERPWNEDPWDRVRPTDEADVDGLLPDLRTYSRQILLGLAAVAVVFVAWAGWQVRSLVTQVDTDQSSSPAADNQVTEVEVVFPEGFTVGQIASRLERDVPGFSAADVETVLATNELAAPFRPEGVTSYEGLLFPALYRIASYESEEDVLARMLEEMRSRALSNDIEVAAQRLGRTPYEIIIIASLIEKEVKVAEERALVSRVIHNRLELDIELQVDAALYYGAPEGASFAQLKGADSPYNVYLRKGLPPTPIANPGEASLIAAMNPAEDPADDDALCTARNRREKRDECRLLFYVLSDSEGRHAFATTYRLHEQNVAAAKAAGILP
ncbi:MAG: endolytic transglycosylase MltG [Actinomycetota bacterium]